ncbi:formylglycine-generating enzyme family protein [Terrabacter sp. NPDC080008]|uniref:formylglycine-generating enzyme family protein n=1 Tax=Terrabacter sp. NPDC080008 TaxID=3155176 RepID=UPI0034500552
MSQERVAEGLTELVDIPAGHLRMGSTSFYPDEGPVRDVEVAAFRLERHPVTTAQFARFVAATGYLTVAERPPDPRHFPGVPAADLVPGGLVFAPTSGPVPLDRWDLWWRWVPGASWRHPRGPGTDTAGLEDHPVVLVAHADALAYAAWAGRRLPTEAEFEYAARGGGAETTYAWGEEARPGGRLMANTWQGRFPYLDTGAHRSTGTSPVGAYPANGYGLVDMIGNTWEWTSTFYATGEDRDVADALGAGAPEPSRRSELAEVRPAPQRTCCAPTVTAAVLARSGPPDDLGDDAAEEGVARRSVAPGELLPRRVLKGGSHLCAPEYCLRYRPAARSPQSIDSATTHIGFRCAAAAAG